MSQEVETCQRCGSTNLRLQEMDLKSPFSQVLKCLECGSVILIPRKEASPGITEMAHSANEAVKRDWRVLAE